MNRTTQWIAVALLAAAASWPATHAAAQSPDVFRNYRLITSRSTLEEPLSGIDQLFAYGTFGLVTGSLELHAAFVDVQSWLFRPNQSHQWADQKLNLSGLEGTHSPSDPNRLVFQGVDGQNQPFTLTAVQRGQLLHLTGENNPACCSFVKYKFDALAYEAPYADFNLDGVVDGDDASVIVSNMGTPANILSFELGDADGNGIVNGNDYLTWQREIGAATAMSEFVHVSSAGLNSSSTVVPEPGAIELALLFLVPHIIRRHR